MNNITEYNLEYEDVLCIGVDWEEYEFMFVFKGKKYLYKQKGGISCSADTDHIRCVIKEFKSELMTRFFDENFGKGDDNND